MKSAPAGLCRRASARHSFLTMRPTAEQLLVEADKRMYANKRVLQRLPETDEVPVLTAAIQ